MNVAVSALRPERLLLGAACVGMLTLGANGTAIMAALPAMRAELGLSDAQLGWTINAYLVVSAACIIPGGRVSDQAGAGRVSLAGLVLFVVASTNVLRPVISDRRSTMPTMEASKICAAV